MTPAERRSLNGLLYTLLNHLLVHCAGLGTHERDVIRTVLYTSSSPANRTQELLGTLKGLAISDKLNPGELRIVSAVVEAA